MSEQTPGGGGESLNPHNPNTMNIEQRMAHMEQVMADMAEQLTAALAQNQANQAPVTPDVPSPDAAPKEGFFSAKRRKVGALVAGLAVAAGFGAGIATAASTGESTTTAPTPIATTTEAAAPTTTTEATAPATTTETKPADAVDPNLVTVTRPEATKPVIKPVDAPNAKPAPAKDAPKKKTARERMIVRADNAPTVALATKALRGGRTKLKANLRVIEGMDAKKVNHTEHGMNRIDAVFKDVDKIGPNNGAEALALGINSSKGNATATYNALHGKDASAELPDGVSVKEAREYFFDKATAKGTEFKVETPTGSFMNHGQEGEDVRKAGEVQLDGTQRVLTMTLANGKKVYYKLFNNGCINILTPIKKAAPAPAAPGAPNAAPGAPGITGNTPSAPGAPGITGNTPPATITPEGKTPAPNKPGRPNKPERTPEKHDPNRTPGGNDGQDGGDPTGVQEPTRPQPGNAPEGSGQPQAPEPTPITPAPDDRPPESQEPPVRGEDPGVDGPGEPAEGSDTPAGPINDDTRPN